LWDFDEFWFGNCCWPCEYFEACFGILFDAVEYEAVMIVVNSGYLDLIVVLIELLLWPSFVVTVCCSGRVTCVAV